MAFLGAELPKPHTGQAALHTLVPERSTTVSVIRASRLLRRARPPITLSRVNRRILVRTLRTSTCYLLSVDLEVPGVPNMDKACTRGLQVAPRLTRQILVEAKHPAPSTQKVFVSFAVANARGNWRFAIHRGSANIPLILACIIGKRIEGLF